MPLLKPLLAAVLGTAIVPVAALAQSAPSSPPNPARGKQLFLQCQACHTIIPGAPHTVGPNLAGVVGAKAGSRPGYDYSPALAKYGQIWNATSLDAFVQRPSKVVPGTKMAFAGVADAKARADIVAYLMTIKGKK